MTRASEDKVLVLLRHAKAEQSGYDRDHERGLTDRGWRDAEAAGHWLASHGIGCDEVFCSTSARTRQTAEGVQRAGCAEADVRYERLIYNAAPETILSVVQDSEPDAQVVMVVGHAPGIPSLASLLADGEGNAEAHARMAEGFATSGVAVLLYSGHWSDLAFGAARLDEFVVPRGATKDAETTNR